MEKIKVNTYKSKVENLLTIRKVIETLLGLLYIWEKPNKKGNVNDTTDCKQPKEVNLSQGEREKEVSKEGLTNREGIRGTLQSSLGP